MEIEGEMGGEVVIGKNMEVANLDLGENQFLNLTNMILEEICQFSKLRLKNKFFLWIKPINNDFFNNNEKF